MKVPMGDYDYIMFVDASGDDGFKFDNLFVNSLSFHTKAAPGAGTPRAAIEGSRLSDGLTALLSYHRSGGICNHESTRTTAVS